MISCSSYDKLSQKEKRRTRKEQQTKILFTAQCITQNRDTAILFIFRVDNFFEQMEWHKYSKQKYFYGNYFQTENKIDFYYKNDSYVSEIKHLYWNASRDTLVYFNTLMHQKWSFPKNISN